jgi:hypothetical protein
MSKRIVTLAAIAALTWLALAGAGKSQARAGLGFGHAPAAAFGGVTNIKEVVNRTNETLVVEKIDFTGNAITGRREDTGNIPPDGVWTGDMWVPWANNAEEFTNHRIEIHIWALRPGSMERDGGWKFFVWQTGEYVRFNEVRRFVENAPRVPGLARAGGERRLVISAKADKDKGQKFTFAFEKLNP